MSRYIDADWIKSFFEADKGKDRNTPIDSLLALIDDAPTIERKRGEWETVDYENQWIEKHTGFDDFGDVHTITEEHHVKYKRLKCPFCGAFAPDGFDNYCSRCGARLIVNGYDDVDEPLPLPDSWREISE